MGGIKIFRLQEWKVLATACTRSLNLAAAAVVFPATTDNTLYNPTTHLTLMFWGMISISYRR